MVMIKFILIYIYEQETNQIILINAVLERTPILVGHSVKGQEN